MMSKEQYGKLYGEISDHWDKEIEELARLDEGDLVVDPKVFRTDLESLRKNRGMFYNKLNMYLKTNDPEEIERLTGELANDAEAFQHDLDGMRRKNGIEKHPTS